jgi:integrase
MASVASVLPVKTCLAAFVVIACTAMTAHSDSAGGALKKGSRSSSKKYQRKRKKFVRDVWPTIRLVSVRGAMKYQVDCRVQNVEGTMEGARKFYDSREEAELFAEQRAMERKNEGTAILTLSADQERQAVRAFRILKERGVKVDLIEVVNGYLRHMAKVEELMTVEKLVERFLAHKRNNPKRALSKRHLGDLKHRLDLFVNGRAVSDGGQEISGFGKCAAHKVGHREIEAWLLALPQGRTTRSKYRTHLNSLFNFGEQIGASGENPIRRVVEIGKDEPPKGILTVAQAKRLLERADEGIKAAVAIGLFAGLRPEAELCRLDWADVHLNKEMLRDPAGNEVQSYGFIEVRHSKGASGERMVHIQPNLYDWLKRLRPRGKRSGPVCKGYDRFNELLKKAAKAARISPWPHDALRHTFCTMHFAAFRDEARTMADSGHRNVTTFRKHYRRPLQQKVAFEFWKIMPPKKGAESAVVEFETEEAA